MITVNVFLRTVLLSYENVLNIVHLTCSQIKNKQFYRSVFMLEKGGGEQIETNKSSGIKLEFLKFLTISLWFSALSTTPIYDQVKSHVLLSTVR